MYCSIIIPTKNRHLQLYNTLQSIIKLNSNTNLFEIIIVNSKKNTDLVLVHDGWALAKLYTTLTNSNMDDDAFNKTDILDKQEIINLFKKDQDPIIIYLIFIYSNQGDALLVQTI